MCVCVLLNIVSRYFLIREKMDDVEMKPVTSSGGEDMRGISVPETLPHSGFCFVLFCFTYQSISNEGPPVVKVMSPDHPKTPSGNCPF